MFRPRPNPVDQFAYPFGFSADQETDFSYYSQQQLPNPFLLAALGCDSIQVSRREAGVEEAGAQQQEGPCTNENTIAAEPGTSGAAINQREGATLSGVAPSPPHTTPATAAAAAALLDRHRYSRTNPTSSAVVVGDFDFSSYQLPSHQLNRHSLPQSQPSSHQLSASLPSPSSPTTHNLVRNRLNDPELLATARLLRQTTVITKMDEGVAATDDLAAQEAAAREYQPQLTGPLVGFKQPSHAITEEYAKADPVYVEKTMALPNTYSHYRPILGDGNCGWRAIGYAYFETLILTATSAKIKGEHERITSLNDYISNVGGYGSYIWEDMVDETLALLKEIGDFLVQGDQDGALSHLHTRFNQPEVSSAIVYHLRMLAASYLKGHPTDYEPFTNGGVQNHCSGTIEPIDREIDHLGVTLLVEVLLRPAGFVLEIAYLDRSAGEQVNVYRFPDEANGQDESTLGPVIHLLFRPDHYDILYKPAPQPVDVQVYRAMVPTQIVPEIHQMSQWGMDSTAANINYDVLSMIPGFDLNPKGVQRQQELMNVPSYSQRPDPSASWTSSPTSYTQQMTPPAPSPTSSVTFAPQQSRQQSLHEVPQQSYVAVPHHLQHQHQYHDPPQHQEQQHPIRFSTHCWPTAQSNAFSDFPVAKEEQTLQTATMQNSPLNTIHFNNPNFQPQEYKPGDEGSPKAMANKRKGDQSAKKAKKLAVSDHKAMERNWKPMSH
ncbi:hypothetical protein MCOR25_010338 [Pyricularia grisea]|nr:hypothetical protein MCOR25_010338 [Pyricularia grisea]